MEETGAVVQVHSRPEAASGLAFGETDERTLCPLQWTAQRELQSLLDEGRQRYAAALSLLPCTLQESFFQANGSSHMSEHN